MPDAPTPRDPGPDPRPVDSLKQTVARREPLDRLARRVVDKPEAATADEVRRLGLFVLNHDDEG